REAVALLQGLEGGQGPGQFPLQVLLLPGQPLYQRLPLRVGGGRQQQVRQLLAGGQQLTGQVSRLRVGSQAQGLAAAVRQATEEGLAVPQRGVGGGVGAGQVKAHREELVAVQGEGGQAVPAFGLGGTGQEDVEQALLHGQGALQVVAGGAK